MVCKPIAPKRGGVIGVLDLHIVIPEHPAAMALLAWKVR